MPFNSPRILRTGPGRKVLKAFVKSDALRGFLCWLGALYIRFVYLTGRWQAVDGDIPRRFWDEGKPFILAFWHGRLLMMPRFWDRGTAVSMLISQHRDGQIISRIVGRFGVKTVAGSSSRGGAQALRAMVKSLKAGNCVGITPDGPRGPRMRATDGVVSVARLSGVPIIPAAYSATRGRFLGTWDQFLVPWPFTRGAIVWGKPITVPHKADDAACEAARLEIEESLNALTSEADRLCGNRPLDPAPLLDTPS